ncbi:polymorphic toxin-type HINT domain-containing protein [Streptomyces sp. NPDC051677]|uniref:polymorphic toxin-type HINT domain-containing protein n=1 Tax=Streptomyces sp. NPDC051677 TaxID=3365669 RepID=UPI0037CD6956
MPGTGVLLADGTQKAIEDVEVGDVVVTTDTETGETVDKRVAQTITTEGDKDFTKIVISVDGEHSSIVATDTHPFWVPDLKKWVKAGDLQVGQLLRTSAGTHVQITAVSHYTKRQRTHDLTIEDIHAYYVLAGATPVLVHNCGGGTTVYRGVPEGHPGFDAAVDGSAVPRGGTASAEAHQLGDTESPYTSWSTSEAAARRAATRGKLEWVSFLSLEFRRDAHIFTSMMSLGQTPI